jgi:histidine triad (HIT) family protein
VGNDDCIFCKIVRGEAPAHRLCEDEKTVTILDAFPASKGHALVLTREHYEDIHDVPVETLKVVVENSKRVACILRRELRPDGLGVYQLNGAAAGQTIGHYHMHVIPRTEGQRRSVHGRAAADDESQAALAERLRTALAGCKRDC